MENSSKIPTSSIRKGDVWLAYDLHSNKNRPFIIISDKLVGIDVDMSVLTVTSISKTRNPYDIDLKFWKEAGLFKPSIARCAKVQTLEQKLLRHKLGVLQPEDWEQVRQAVKDYFDF